MASQGTAKLVPGESRLSVPERRLLATMPLHAITAVYGEGGLRERLLIEAGRFPAAERERIAAALALMLRLHKGDRRQREPYASHPLRVAIRVLSHYHYRVADQDVACAALLHDTVEDHAGDIAPGGGRQGALEVLAGQFGERAAGLVGAVTNPPWEAGRDKHEQYRQHVAQSLDGCPWARVVKVPDITDNAVGLSTPPGRACPGAPPSTGPCCRYCEIVLRPDTPLEDDVKHMIAGKLDKAGVRLAAICGDPVPGPPASGGRLG